MMKRIHSGFTLIEVNLAIFVMALGVLSICVLYGLGFRENRQSVEDVYATAYADAVLAPLIVALSSPQITWEEWKSIGEEVSDNRSRWPAKGWAAYVNESGDHYKVISRPTNTAKGVYDKLKGALTSVKGMPAAPDPSGYQYGLVVSREGAVVSLAFRMSKRSQTLFNQPVTVAEVCFQGGFQQSVSKNGGNQ